MFSLLPIYVDTRDSVLFIVVQYLAVVVTSHRIFLSYLKTSCVVLTICLQAYNSRHILLVMLYLRSRITPWVLWVVDKNVKAFRFQRYTKFAWIYILVLPIHRI